MAYIGFNPSQLAIAPFAQDSYVGNGVTTTFTLSQAVPGANEANVEVFVENVQQRPIDSYTIGGALNNQLIFSEAPPSGAEIYVIFKGEATYNLQPATGSVTALSLDPVLRNFRVDTFAGNGSQTQFTLTDTPYSANSILVTVDGIVQTAGVNYTVSGTTLDFGTTAPSEAPDSAANISVVHLGFSTGNKSVMDGAITPLKLSAGGPSWDGNSNLSVTGRLGLGGTYTSWKLGVNGNAFIGPVSSTRSTTKAELNTNSVLTLKPHTTDSTNMNFGSVGSGDVMGIQVTNGGGTANWHIGLNPFGGNVGIGTGTTVPNWLLHLRSQFPYICFEDTDNVNGVQATITGNQDGNMYYDANINNTATKGGHIWRADGGGILMQLEQNVVGASLGRLNLSYGQIKFPAAQNASSDPNTLDDYEEGASIATWIATNGTTSADVRVVSRNEQGGYIKIGSKVTYWARLQHDNSYNATYAGYQLIISLPFAISSSKYGFDSSKGPRIGTASLASGTASYRNCWLYGVPGTSTAQFVLASDNTNFLYSYWGTGGGQTSYVLVEYYTD